MPGLLRESSIELSTNGEAAIRSAAEFLPSGTAVYVPKMPRETLADKLVQIELLSRYGLEPVPHIVARQLTSLHELTDFLANAVRIGGISRVLLIGGDGEVPQGPFADSSSILAGDVLGRYGISTVDVAGYPDGHPAIPADILLADLRTKVTLARGQGIDLNVVTQFSFRPENIVEYCAGLADVLPGLPVHAGLVGPTSPAKLLRFARICGVKTSLRAANKLGSNAIKLAMHANPDKQYDVLLRRALSGATGNLSGIHLFSFGGFVDSSRWLDGRIRSAALCS